MASSRSSASSRDLLVGLQSTAGLVRLSHDWHAPLWPGRHWERPQTLPSPPSPPSPVGSSAVSPASAPSAVSPPPALNTAPLSPLDDASVASDVSGEGGSYGPHAAGPPSSTPSVSGLFDDDSDEETRSVECGDWHPYALPSAPAKHPANGRVNHYDPAAPWDYSASVNIEQLHDVRGESPHRCFLVEWQITLLQLSCV
ncbi:hypothetical protein PInf_006693 [Phytophthora infestans]|nr:hypothetical protein PInf_006693 [Phytophthora infestans]